MSEGLGLFNSGAFTQMARIADSLADSSLLPEHLRGFWARKPNYKQNDAGQFELYPRETRVANCMLVTNAARLWDADPFQLASFSYIVGGKLDFDGKVYASLANVHGGLAEKLSVKYEGDGDELRVTISGRLACEAEPRTVTLHLLEARTKDKRGGVTQQWKNDPAQMLWYAGARKWVRRHCPQVLLGLVSTQEEAMDEESYPAIEAPATMPESQQLITEQRPSDDFSKILATLNSAETVEALDVRVREIKGSRNLSLSKDERDRLNEEVAQLKSSLPSSGPSEAFSRWERTLKTEVDREQILVYAAEVDDDKTLTEIERAELAAMITDILERTKEAATA